VQHEDIPFGKDIRTQTNVRPAYMRDALEDIWFVEYPGPRGLFSQQRRGNSRQWDTVRRRLVGIDIRVDMGSRNSTKDIILRISVKLPPTVDVKHRMDATLAPFQFVLLGLVCARH